jgi:hypothetical protein
MHERPLGPMRVGLGSKPELRRRVRVPLERARREARRRHPRNQLPSRKAWWLLRDVA